jgi:2-iminobutanoate/2-iminopropanoate deaminase
MEHITTDKLPGRGGPYSHAVRTGDIYFLSGQRPVNPVDGSISSDFREQARQVFTNLGTVLQECGSDFSKVAKVNVYLSDIGDFAALNEVYLEFFQEPFPARTTISCVLRGILIEVDVVAGV